MASDAKTVNLETAFQVERFDVPSNSWKYITSTSTVFRAKKIIEGQLGEWRIIELRPLVIWTNSTRREE